ncbi:unnamed protein product, partial [Rotaria magnacalcarata]
MSKWWYYWFYTILLCLITDLLNAQHHSVYIPNYLQAFDYPNVDETASPHQQQDQSDEQFNDGFDPLQFDFFQTTETSPDIQNLLDASTMHTDITTENS